MLCLAILLCTVLVVLVACNVLSLIDCLGDGVVTMRGVCVACSKLLAGYHGLPRSYHVVGGVAW